MQVLALMLRLAATAPLAAGCAPGEAASAPRDPDPYRADLRALTVLVCENWSYLEHRRELSGVDPQALEARALAELEASEEPRPRAFLRALTRYVAGLEDGHAGVAWDGATLDTRRRLPLHLSAAVEGIVVTGVAEGVEGVAIGDLLLAIDGRPIEALIAERESLTCASTDGMRRALALLFLPLFADGERVRVRVRRSMDDEIVEVDLDCPPRETGVGGRGLLPLWRRDVRVLEDEIGYLRPGSFRWPAGSGWSDAAPSERDAILAGSYAEIDAAFDALAATRALVLDLRANPGGTDLLAQRLAAHLLPPATVYFQLEPSRSSRRSRHHVPRLEGRAPRAGPLVCLIDEGTFSAADNLAACLADAHPNVVFVGRPTGAGTGAPRPFELPRTGATVSFCTMRVRSPEGRMVEGVGVAPDVDVVRTRADLLEERDVALERALEIAGAR